MENTEMIELQNAKVSEDETEATGEIPLEVSQDQLCSDQEDDNTTTVDQVGEDDDDDEDDSENPASATNKRKGDMGEVFELRVNRTKLAKVIAKHRGHSDRKLTVMTDEIINTTTGLLKTFIAKPTSNKAANAIQTNMRKTLNKGKLNVPLTFELNEFIDEINSKPLSEMTGGDVSQRGNHQKKAPPLRVEYTVEHYMAAILFWKLSKHKITEYENTACRKNLDKPMKSYRYDWVVDRFQERYNVDAPSYFLLQSKLKDFKEKKPISTWTDQSNVGKKIEPEQVLQVHNYVKQLPANKVISQINVSKNLKIPLTVVERCLEKDNELVHKRYFRKSYEANSFDDGSDGRIKGIRFSVPEKKAAVYIYKQVRDKKFNKEYSERERYAIAQMIFRKKFNREAPIIKTYRDFVQAVAKNQSLQRKMRNDCKVNDEQIQSKIREELMKCNGVFVWKELAKNVGTSTKTLRLIIDEHMDLKNLVKGHSIMKVRSYDRQKELIREMLKESNNKITRQQICDRLGIKLMCLYLWMRKDSELAEMIGYKQVATNPAMGRSTTFCSGRRGKKTSSPIVSISDPTNEVQLATQSIEQTITAQTAESVTYNLRSVRSANAPGGEIYLYQYVTNASTDV